LYAHTLILSGWRCFMGKATAKAKVQKVPVSVRALLQRVNRKLAQQNERVCRTRPVFDVAGGDAERMRPSYDRNLGQFYKVNAMGILATHLDLETEAREIGCLAPYEAMED
jgi:hypothetical protein